MSGEYNIMEMWKRYYLGNRVTELNIVGEGEKWVFISKLVHFSVN